MKIDWHCQVNVEKHNFKNTIIILKFYFSIHYAWKIHNTSDTVILFF